jgi:hypothetical protein
LLLTHQSEKQRIIWAYKILFLDVLFPLDVDRIIFVDSDQVVRADLGELMDMDIGVSEEPQTLNNMVTGHFETLCVGRTGPIVPIWASSRTWTSTSVWIPKPHKCVCSMHA